jgi:hypothetical protein
MTMARTQSSRLAAIVLLATTLIMALYSEMRGLMSFSEAERLVSSKVAPTTEIPLLVTPRIVDMVHLYNPFRVSNCLESFCPYDQAQSIAIASMKRSQANAQGKNSSLSIILAAVTFSDELDIIPRGFVQLDPLTRSTASKYSNMTVGGVRKRLPFWQDILQSLLNQQAFRARTIIYTNSDIILHENFYSIVHEKLQQGNKAFTINRQTVPTKEKNVTTHQLFTAKDLDDIFSISDKGLKDHPGTDCFIFPWEMALKFDLGDIFLGYPPFGVSLASSLLHYTVKNNFNNRTNYTSYTGYRRFGTRETKSTYHLGNDLDWRANEENKAYIALNQQNADDMANVDWKTVFGGRGPRLKVLRGKIGQQQQQQQQQHLKPK